MKRKMPWLIVVLLSISFSCHRQVIAPDLRDMHKVHFDYTNLDAGGFRNGISHVDYEFCIPREDKALEQVRKIEPDVKVMKSSRGRIGCTDQQWLCIVSTADDEWKKKLEQIATLSFVQRIEETFYE